MQIHVPTTVTLKKYGFTEEMFWALWREQGEVCPVCQKCPSTGRVVFDHEHVLGWKAMPPEQRALYVRGLTCWFCNHSYLGRGITVEKARNAAEYLRQYAVRRAGL